MGIQIYTNNFKSSLRVFQYQVLLRSLLTSKLFYKYKLSTTEKCKFCEVNAKTMEHLFWLCPSVKTFWFMIIDKLNARWENQLNYKNVLLCNCKGTMKDSYNFLFIVGKKYIYSTKCRGNQLSIDEFMNLLKYFYKLNSK